MPFATVAHAMLLGSITTTLLISTTLFSAVSHAASVKADPLAAKGCMPRIPKEDALNAMRRFHMKSFNGTSMEIRTLGTALAYIEKLNGGKPLARATADPEHKFGVHFFDANRSSSQETGKITLNRNGAKRYGENMAQIVHEIGHYVGNNGGYGAYYSAMGGHYCLVSSYSDNNSHEQFAEVFAAFVTRPALLKNNESANCRKAFKFFSTVIFPPSSTALVAKCIAKQFAVAAAVAAVATPNVAKPAAKPAQNSTPAKPASSEVAKPEASNAAKLVPAAAKPEAGNASKPASINAAKKTDS